MDGRTIRKAWKFVCEECGEVDWVVADASKPPDPPSCKCGKRMHSDFGPGRDNSCYPGMGGTELARTFFSDSLAISPDQTEEHRRLFPNVEVTPDGRLGFHSHAERERYCEATGFVKVPSRREY